MATPNAKSATKKSTLQTKNNQGSIREKQSSNKNTKKLSVTMLYAKIHRAVVTDANLNYIGSISIDEALMEESGILEGMQVEILNINNGERFSTYAIKAKRNSGDICLNGAAARKVQKGDIVIIVAYATMKLKHAKSFKPKIVFVDSNNQKIEKE